MRPKKKQLFYIILFFLFFIFLALSFFLKFKPGIGIAKDLKLFGIGLIQVLPPAFLLIGLFEVWVKKETVTKHLGMDSGFRGYLWAIIIAGTTVGGLYVAFPVAYTLRKKGAKLTVIFTYVAASAIVRIPMTIFEISFMEIKFTIVRLAISIPLIIISSILLGNFLEKKNYQIMKGR